jgi:hypothetical protein
VGSEGARAFLSNAESASKLLALLTQLIKVEPRGHASLAMTFLKNLGLDCALMLTELATAMGAGNAFSERVKSFNREVQPLLLGELIRYQETSSGSDTITLSVETINDSTATDDWITATESAPLSGSTVSIAVAIGALSDQGWVKKQNTYFQQNLPRLFFIFFIKNFSTIFFIIFFKSTFF